MSKVIDPVCGHRLEASAAAATSEYEGRTYHFHALECQRVFDANPDAYVGERAAPLDRSRPRNAGEAPFPAPKFGAAGSGGAEYGGAPPPPDEDERPDPS